MTKQNIATLEGHTGLAWSVSFSPDGKLIASTDIVFNENGDPLGSTIRLWDVETKQNIATLEGHTGLVWSVSFSPDGKLIASTDIVSDENDAIVGSTIKLWDIGTKENIATFEVDVPASGTYEDWALRSVLLGGPSIPFSPDGTLLAYSVPDDTTKLWNVQTRENIATLSEDAAFVSFSPDGRQLAYTDSEGIKFYDMQASEITTTLLLPERYLEDLIAMSFSPDGGMFMLVREYSVTLWNVNSGSDIARLEDISNLSFATASFSPDGTLLATVGLLDNKVILWD